MEKKFKVAYVRGLLNQVHTEKITFSRFVEILNETASGKQRFDIDKIDSEWSRSIDKGFGLNEAPTAEAFKELKNKLNEVIEYINPN